MASPIQLDVKAVAPSGARAGVLHTRRGATPTPTFMPVATHAHVRTLSMDEVASTGASICLANTYHLLLRPGTEVFDAFGGIHRYMRWSGGVLTDSGGFQIFSLPGDRQISEQGARFRSPYDNHICSLSPETSISTQQSIGSDIMMVLDVCVPSTSDHAVTADAMERTHRWALRSLAAARAKDTGQALFAIVQGGIFPELRSISASFLIDHPFDGFAIGGLAVGEARELLYATTQHTARLLPADRPRYLMGVGTPIDLVESVNSGIDMFDCIVPAKMAQQGYAYTFEGQLRISRIEYRCSDEPIDSTCGCEVCQKYTRAYVRHLAHGNHFFGARLLAIHNLWHYQALMRRMREAILENRWDAEYRVLKELLSPAVSRPKPVGIREGHFELVTLKSGARAVRHSGHGEVMHPIGPWEEANRLYIEQLNVKRRLSERNDDPLRILDVGLGAGANAIAALQCAAELGDERKRALEIVSLEIDLSPLSLASSDLEGFPFMAPWKMASDSILSHGHWEGPDLSWRVLVGDAAKLIEEVDGQFDLIFFDPFSPESNPTLWSIGFLRAIRSRTRHQGGLLATYSAATPTRVSMLAAGFFVGHGASTGTRQETTVASTKIDLLSAPLGERWLARWQRSSARAPHGEALSPELEARIVGHAQFR